MLKRNIVKRLAPPVISEIVSRACWVRNGLLIEKEGLSAEFTKVGCVDVWLALILTYLPSKNGVNLYCAVIVKRVDARTRAKTSVNELLRD